MTIRYTYIRLMIIRKGCTSGELFQFRCPDASVQSVHEHSRHPDPDGNAITHHSIEERIKVCKGIFDQNLYILCFIIKVPPVHRSNHFQIASSSTSASRGKLGGMVAATEVSLTPTLSPAKGFPFILLNKITIQSIISQAGDCGRALWQLVQPVLH